MIQCIPITFYFYLILNHAFTFHYIQLNYKKLYTVDPFFASADRGISVGQRRFTVSHYLLAQLY